MISVDDRTRFWSSGFRRHWDAFASDVAVMRMSGWCMRRFSFAVMYMVGRGRPVELDGGVSNLPMMLMISPVYEVMRYLGAD